MAASQAVFSNVEPAHADTPEKLVWSQCNVNCGGRCIFHWHTKDGKIQYMTTDDIGNDDFQARACLRGRVMRQWVNNPDRLQYPMKRVGARGEGKFERISWDEAIQTIADKIRYTIDTYGNDSIYVNYATGMYSATGRSVERLLNCVGGYLPMYGDYSTGMHQYVMPFMYGVGVSPYENISASSVDQAQNADLVLMFGNSPADNRMGGANVVWDYNTVREAGPEIIHIDYRLNETAAGYPSEWLPIRTGTDAALVAGIAHELITNDWVDLDFLHKYCVGYDEETMPASAKGQNKSYHDYIMGLGYDKVEKTPEWAAEITLVPAEKIRELAAKIHDAKAVFVVQGWGLQRHSNGESATRAVCMLALLTGNLGKPGTNSGMREAEPPGAPVGSLPASDEDPNGAPMNMVNAKISCYSWLKCIDEGKDFQKELDATDEIALFMGAQNPEMAEAAAKIEKPKNGIKMLWNYAGNCISNQHGDINKVYEVLSDESKCEFIVGCDTFMPTSLKSSAYVISSRSVRPRTNGSKSSTRQALRQTPSFPAGKASSSRVFTSASFPPLSPSKRTSRTPWVIPGTRLRARSRSTPKRSLRSQRIASWKAALQKARSSRLFRSSIRAWKAMALLPTNIRSTCRVGTTRRVPTLRSVRSKCSRITTVIACGSIRSMLIRVAFTTATRCA